MKVTLIGAGPGDAELLTIKGLKQLQSADVVLYDRLVGEEIISLIPQQAEKINVGKCVNNHPIPQHEISKMLIEKAKEGKNVVRLKGGDSFVFGRGGEELELLAEENIPFEVIPGITSSIAGAAYAGIPITHRDYASSFHVVTGHAKENCSLDIDFEALVRTKGTLIFMMSVSTIEQICKGCLDAGMEKDMPAAIVENATTSNQRKFIGTVETISKIAIDNKVVSPSIIIIGKVCILSEKLDFFIKKPLLGKKVIVTRARASESKLTAELRELGCGVIEMPSIKIVPCINENMFFKNMLSHFGDYGWLIFTSAVGVNIFFDYLLENQFDIRRLHHIKIAVVGSETKKEVMKRGLTVDFMPNDYNSIALAKGIASQANKNEKLLILRAKIGSEDILNILQQFGFNAIDIGLYDTLFEDILLSNGRFDISEVDYVTFTSSSTVEGFVRALPNYNFAETKAVCIGKQTANTAEKYGFPVFVSEQATIASIVEKIKELSTNE